MSGLYVIGCKHRDEPCRCTSLLYRRSAPGLQSLYQAGDAYDVKAKIPRGFNGLNGRAARSADVIHNHHARAFLLKAFHAATHAVRFLRFAHEKTVNGNTGLRADDRGGNHDGIGAHGESAYGLRLPALLAEKIEKDAASEFGAEGVKRGGAAIDVVIAPGAGRKREFAKAEGVGGQQVEELFARGSHRF